jgi:hypothetical protein
MQGIRKEQQKTALSRTSSAQNRGRLYDHRRKETFEMAAIGEKHSASKMHHGYKKARYITAIEARTA